MPNDTIKYRKDRAYREQVKANSRRVYKRRKRETTVKGERLSVGDLAVLIGISARQIQNLILLGVIPDTREGVGRGGARRYYTQEQARIIKMGLDQYQVSDLLWISRRYDIDGATRYIADNWR